MRLFFGYILASFVLTTNIQLAVADDVSHKTGREQLWPIEVHTPQPDRTILLNDYEQNCITDPVWSACHLAEYDMAHAGLKDAGRRGYFLDDGISTARYRAVANRLPPKKDWAGYMGEVRALKADAHTPVMLDFFDPSPDDSVKAMRRNLLQSNLDAAKVSYQMSTRLAEPRMEFIRQLVWLYTMRQDAASADFALSELAASISTDTDNPDADYIEKTTLAAHGYLLQTFRAAKPSK